MLLLLPGTIVLLSVPSLFANLGQFHSLDASVLVRGLLGVIWVMSGFALFHQHGRLEQLRESLVGQMDGATKSHVRAEKLYGLSIIDPLTGLYNRRFGETRLQEEITRAGDSKDPLLVLALDFDGFKGINDTYGHAAGDAALKTFSRRLQRAIRACDVPIRCGGDEFLMILPECPPDKVPDIFSRMGPVTIPVNGKQIPVRFSYGMAQCEVGDTPANMIKRADERLYDSKAKRKAAAAAEKAGKAAEATAQAKAKDAAIGSRTAAESGRPGAVHMQVRRSTRLARKIAILVTGNDLGGAVFLEQTNTVDLSRYGAAIISRHKLASEQEVILRCVDTNKEAEARVVRVIESQSDGHKYGLAFGNSAPNIWDIEFPPLSESDREAAGSLFECTVCRGRERTKDEGGCGATVERSCRRCGSKTPWLSVRENNGAIVGEVVAA